MDIEVGVNSYVTEIELTTYATDRGKTVSGDTDVLLIQAMDYIETRPYSGDKTDPEQALQFPRNEETEVPQDIKTAQIVIALLIDSGVDFFATVDRAIKRKKVAGIIETEYMDNASQVPDYPQVDILLKQFYAVGGIYNLEVVRG